MSNSKSVSINLGPWAVFLTVVFVILKLTETVSWSWLWVLSPLWITFGLSLAIALIAFLVLGIVALFGRKNARPSSSYRNRRIYR